MKRIILILSLAVTAAAANAQASGHSKWEENGGSNQLKIRQDNEFALTEISASGRVITFTDLPALTKPTWAVVTDVNGEVLSQRRISPSCNTMDLGRLPKNSLYFVTLMYRNKSQKAFTLNF